MATAGWRSGVALKDQLRHEYVHFDFYQLVRLLLREQATGPAQGGEPGARLTRESRGGVGTEDADSIDSVLRFRGDLSFAFPAHEVSALSPGGPDRTVELSTPNYAVATAIGPLPEPFAELVAERATQGDRAAADFLDIFNHRINALRFRIKARNHLSLSNQRPEDTPHAHYLAAIMGLGTDRLAQQLPLPTRALLGLAGVLANRRRSGPVIANILRRYLDAPLEMEQLRGAWQFVEPDQWNKLGKANSTLGRSAALGRRAWDPQARIRLRIGPLPYDRFCELLPDPDPPPQGETVYSRFVALLRYLTDRRLDTEVELSVDPSTVPASQLRAPDAEAPRHRVRFRGLRLAQTAWLGVRDEDPGVRPDTRDPDLPAAQYLIPAFDPPPREQAA